MANVTPAPKRWCLTTSSFSAEEPSPNWLALPREITAAILHRLGPIEILNDAQRVCLQWRGICREPAMWRTIDMRNGSDRMKKQEDLEVMCRHAVDRSCGGLVDISIEHFATDKLLDHITASCTQIKNLQLVSCYRVSDGGLCQASAKLPLLEDLELPYCSFTEAALEAVGRHCPRLMLLKLNRRSFRYPEIEFDGDAQAIAKTVPELCCLQLFGNRLINKGLKAILDGCPHLEFLDLRQCCNVDLSSKLGKRCSERVKDLRRPLDSADDYEYPAELQEDLDDGYLYDCCGRDYGYSDSD